MHKFDRDLARLQLEVLRGPASAALPANLSDYLLDSALTNVEMVVNADTQSDPSSLRIPLSLVLHLLGSRGEEDPMSISDEELFRYVKLLRLELAMEKLRRWGVRLAPAATVETIFEEH